MSLSTYYLEYGSHFARLHRRRHRRRRRRRRRRGRRRAYAPTSNTASHDNHEKINSWLSFCFPYEYGALLGGPSGRRSSANIREYPPPPLPGMQVRIELNFGRYTYTIMKGSHQSCMAHLQSEGEHSKPKTQHNSPSLERIRCMKSRQSFSRLTRSVGVWGRRASHLRITLIRRRRFPPSENDCFAV